MPVHGGHGGRSADLLTTSEILRAATYEQRNKNDSFTTRARKKR